MSDKHNSILTAEKIGLIKNIIRLVPMRPTRLVCHEKNLNDGLKLGADAKSSPRQAKLTAAYDKRKSTELSCAILFSEPMSKNSWTKNQVVATAAKGLSLITP